MSKIAFVYPGQGTQFVGMGKELYENNVKAKELFDKIFLMEILFFLMLLLLFFH